MLYCRLNEAFHQYTHDVPEAEFPTFLESLLFERIPGVAPGERTLADSEPRNGSSASPAAHP